MTGTGSGALTARAEPPAKGPAGFRPRYRFGVVCVLTGSLFTSTAGILVRLVESADGWQLLAYRQVSFVVVLLGTLAVLYRDGLWRAFRAVGRPGLAVAVALGTAFCAYLFALQATTVADVVFVLSTSPFAAGLLAWIVLREPVSGRLWLAMLAAFAGMAIMVWGGLGEGALAGQLLALVAVAGYAVTLVAFRSRPEVDMLPAVCLAGILASVFAVFMAATTSGGLVIGAHDMLIGLALGVVQLGLQYILVTAGARHIRAAEVALLTRIQAILAPLWVWIGIGEVPATTTLVGGGVVMLAVVFHTLGAFRSRAVAPEG